MKVNTMPITLKKTKNIENIIKPNWQVPINIKAFMTTRKGGVSQPPFASLNLGLHVMDNAGFVKTNRQ